jgi:hypothetical protein
MRSLRTGIGQSRLVRYDAAMRRLQFSTRRLLLATTLAGASLGCLAIAARHWHDYDLDIPTGWSGVWALIQFWAIGPLAAAAALALVGRARWGIYLGLLMQLNLILVYSLCIVGWRLAWNDPGFMRIVTADVTACAVTLGALAFLVWRRRRTAMFEPAPGV